MFERANSESVETVASSTSPSLLKQMLLDYHVLLGRERNPLCEFWCLDCICLQGRSECHFILCSFFFYFTPTAARVTFGDWCTMACYSPSLLLLRACALRSPAVRGFERRKPRACVRASSREPVAAEAFRVCASCSYATSPYIAGVVASGLCPLTMMILKIS